jgi:putative transposase
MPRANRHFLPGYVWHITHRRHQKPFLLKFPRDRRRYLHWLFAAKKRFGLCVLDFIVTSNHVHLLVKDTGEDAIAQSMQLIAGRTAQEYNERKNRHGAFWEDRYHATAIEADEHEYSDGAYALREQGEAYNGDFGGKTEPLSIQNAVHWNENPESADT